MDNKYCILIIEHQDEWLGNLRRAFPENDFTVKTVSTYKDALAALDDYTYDLAVIDPALGNSDSDSDDYEGHHEGLDTLKTMAARFPHTRLIIVSGAVDEALIQNTPEIPQDTHVFDKVHWDHTSFRREVNRLLMGIESTPP